MILAPTIMAAKAALILAAAPVSGPGIVCSMTDTPQVSVRVQADEIDYDYSQDARALSNMESGTISPFDKGVDTVTGGMRANHPQVRTAMDMSVKYNEQTGMGCMAYKTIDVTIRLRPKIFIAREFNTGVCGQAVMGHEKKHVKVDLEISNKYANVIEHDLREMVSHVGSYGPFPMSRQEEVKTMFSKNLQQAMATAQKHMQQDIRTGQQAVDNLAEYKRVGEYCHNITVRK